jgi:hypothetical protein
VLYGVQSPLVHVCDAVHATPAAVPVHVPVAPQNALLVAGLTHDVPHRSSGGSHVHTPDTQLLPALHAVPPEQVAPLAPQYVLLVFGLTHAPLHKRVPDWQVHTPFEHAAPGGHAT